MTSKRFSQVFCLVAISLTSGCFPQGDQQDRKSGFHPSLNQGYQLKLSTYENCDSLQQHIDQQFQSLRHYQTQVARGDIQAGSVNDMAPVNSVEADQGSSTDGEASITNLQEKGVDEPDFVKRNDHHIYVMHGTNLEVLDRQSLSHLGQINLEGFVAANFYHQMPVTPFQVYAFGNRLILIGAKENQQVQVMVYESSQGALPSLLTSWHYRGNYLDSRLSQGKLYLVLNDYLDVNYDWGQANSQQAMANQKVKVENARVRDVPCQRIVRPSIDDMDFSLTKIASFELGQAPQEIDIVGVLGASSELYMSPNHIYVVKQGYSWVPWLTDVGADQGVSTVISKIRLDTAQGLFLPFAHGKVNGYPKDQWSFKELADGSLAVATTSWQTLKNIDQIPYRENLEVGRNHLWILSDEGEDLKLRSAIINFGEPGEDIRAVRFVEEKAYVVTFLNTDPLYSFDLSNSLEPRLLGQLKVPGFSTYLHPVAGASLLIGLGFDALEESPGALHQGLLLSLFDVADPGNMKRSDYRILGQRGSYSDATSNHHAFFYEAANQWLGFPFVELSNPRDSSPWAYGEQLEFSGAILFQITDPDNPASARLEEMARLSHLDFMPATCQDMLTNGRWWSEKVDSLDINRMFRHQDWIVTVSRFGLKAYTMDGSFQVERNINFNHQESCQNRNHGDIFQGLAR